MRILSLMLLLFGISFAKSLDLKQLLMLKTVKNIAKSYPDKRGRTFEKSAMAICMVESGCGKTNFGDKQLLKRGIKKASYGIMQVRLQTARFVSKVYSLYDVKMMSDATLIDRLMNDDRFSVKLAVLYLVWLSDHSNSYFEMISRYNGGKVNYPYFNKVKRELKYLSRYSL